MAVAEKGDSGEMWDDLNLDIIAGIDGRHWPMGGRHCWRFGESLRSAVIWTGPGRWTWLRCPGDRGDVIDAVPKLPFPVFVVLRQLRQWWRGKLIGPRISSRQSFSAFSAVHRCALQEGVKLHRPHGIVNAFHSSSPHLLLSSTRQWAAPALPLPPRFDLFFSPLHHKTQTLTWQLGTDRMVGTIQPGPRVRPDLRQLALMWRVARMTSLMLQERDTRDVRLVLSEAGRRRFAGLVHVPCPRRTREHVNKPLMKHRQFLARCINFPLTTCLGDKRQLEKPMMRDENKHGAMYSDPSRNSGFSTTHGTHQGHFHHHPSQPP